MRTLVIVTLLSLSLAPVWAASGKEDEARNSGASSLTDAQIQSITRLNSDDRGKTRLETGKGSSLDPFSELLRAAYYGQGTTGQGEAGGTVVCPCPDRGRLSGETWTPTQRYRRFTGRDLRVPPYTVGDQIRIRTTFRPNGVRETVVRDLNGNLIYWGVEERSGYPGRLYVP